MTDAAIERRHLIAVAAGMALWAAVPWPRGAAQGANQKPFPPIGPGRSPDLSVFLRVSRHLTGRDELDEDMARSIFGLVIKEPYGEAHLARVYKRIRDWQRTEAPAVATAPIPPHRLDPAERWFASHLLVTWYTGTYYHTSGDRVVSYQGALMYEDIADMVRRPTFCAEPPDDWTRPPRLTTALTP